MKGQPGTVRTEFSNRTAGTGQKEQDGQNMTIRKGRGDRISWKEFWDSFVLSPASSKCILYEPSVLFGIVPPVTPP